jgi:hypothetical protein
MGIFKKPIIVKCYNNEELGKLINWLRIDEGLSAIHQQRYTITVVMPMQYWDHQDRVMYFEVAVPYYRYKKLGEQFIEEEAFDPILEQRAFDSILTRDTPHP